MAKTERNNEIVVKILCSGKIKPIADEYGLSHTVTRRILLSACKKANWPIYESGINDLDATNNYMTPPLKFLCDNCYKFLQPIPEKKQTKKVEYCNCGSKKMNICCQDCGKLK